MRRDSIIPRIKVSENVTKITNPHFKKVYRLFDRETGKADRGRTSPSTTR